MSDEAMKNEQFTETYEKYSDVMYVDVAVPQKGAVIETVDVGDELGLPGQIIVRYDAATGNIYGMTIERYSAVDRKLRRDMHKEAIQDQIRCLLEKVMQILSHLVPTIHGEAQLA